mmetsp:Transcript_26556/g.81648  ORF Transcript_26556/g.81648 Transcript_26556/m.81648 type:complete len:237 (+) Transcript_26556:211-921(+)
MMAALNFGSAGSPPSCAARVAAQPENVNNIEVSFFVVDLDPDPGRDRRRPPRLVARARETTTHSDPRAKTNAALALPAVKERFVCRLRLDSFASPASRLARLKPQCQRLGFACVRTNAATPTHCGFAHQMNEQPGRRRSICAPLRRNSLAADFPLLFPTHASASPSTTTEGRPRHQVKEQPTSLFRAHLHRRLRARLTAPHFSFFFSLLSYGAKQVVILCITSSVDIVIVSSTHGQ